MWDFKNLVCRLTTFPSRLSGEVSAVDALRRATMCSVLRHHADRLAGHRQPGWSPDRMRHILLASSAAPLGRVEHRCQRYRRRNHCGAGVRGSVLGVAPFSGRASLGKGAIPGFPARQYSELVGQNSTSQRLRSSLGDRLSRLSRGSALGLSILIRSLPGQASPSGENHRWAGLSQAGAGTLRTSKVSAVTWACCHRSGTFPKSGAFSPEVTPMLMQAR